MTEYSRSGETHRFVGWRCATGIAVAAMALSQAGCETTQNTDPTTAPYPDQTGVIAVCDTPGLSDMSAKERHGESGEVAMTYTVVHSVEKGQNLTEIAQCYYPDVDTEVAVRAIQLRNSLKKDTIHPGQLLQLSITNPVQFYPGEGKTIIELAERAGLDSEIIASMNGHNPEDTVSANEQLVLPQQAAPDSGARYAVVKPGDTYTKLARRYDTTLSQILSSNQIPAEALEVGDLIMIPAATRSSAQVGVEHTPQEKLQDYVASYAPLAEKIEATYGVPAALVLAQTLHETGYGTSELFKNANNVAGIKADEAWVQSGGETYEKQTTEELEKGEMVTVTALFRKYPSIEAGFEGYGQKLKDSDYYKDAFLTDTPYEFLGRLVDANGPKYATDSQYFDKVSGVIKNVQDVLAGQTQPAQPETQAPVNTEAKAVDAEVARRIDELPLSVEGYEQFKAGIVDTVAYASRYTNFNPELANQQAGKEILPQGETHFVVLHYTVAEYANNTGEGFADSMNYSKKADQKMGSGVNYFLNKQAITYQLTGDNVKVSHVAPNRFSSTSVGMEIEALDQQSVTAQQYGQAAYWSVAMLEKHGLIDSQRPLSMTELRDLVRGHGENNELNEKEVREVLGYGGHMDFGNGYTVDGTAYDHASDRNERGEPLVVTGVMTQLRAKIAALLTARGYTVTP